MPNIDIRASDAARIHAHYLRVKDTPEEKERRRQKAARERAANRELCLERTRAWRARNTEQRARYRQDRSAAYAAHQAKRRAAELNRTPAWADERQTQAIYEAASNMSREFGVEMQVDHVIPLQGDLVSGLHIHSNLQIIPALLNQQKNNHFKVAA